jgi:integrase
MPKSHRPSLLFHKPSGQARVRIDGKDHYLGAFGSPEAQARYDLLIDEWLRRKSLDRATITVDELALRFLEHAIGYYVKDGVQTSEVPCIRLALRPVVRLFGNSLACQFGPLKLKQARQVMIDAGAKRSTINRHIGRIKLAFRWAVENELLRVEVFSALSTVRGLAQGRTEAAEADPVKPVAQAFVEAVRPHVSRQVWAMVELQLLTSARPGEIVSMRVGEINTSGRIWEYVPSSHKAQHHGKTRLIPLGPKAQAVLQEFLRPDLRAYVFSPIEADQERAARRRQERRTPMTPSQTARLPKGNGRRRPREHYTVASYRRAIARACALAEVPSWHPHRLRHTAATEFRRQYGVEATSTMLGHANVRVTELYAEADVKRSRQIALEVG